jgi:transcriptional regulator with XRE-family HTH domain
MLKTNELKRMLGYREHTQQDLAVYLGVTRQAVSQLLRNYPNISHATVLKIVEFCQHRLNFVPIEELAQSET